MSQGQRMLTGMVNMETASRGYLLSGDSRFLAPWDEGLKEFEASWQEAVRLTEDNPAQQRRLDGIRLRHREFVQAVQPLQALRRQVQEGSATVEDLVREFSLGRDPFARDNDVFESSRLFAMQQYRDFLGREGDPGGVDYYAGRLQDGSASRPQEIENFLAPWLN